MHYDICSIDLNVHCFEFACRRNICSFQCFKFYFVFNVRIAKAIISFPMRSQSCTLQTASQASYFLFLFCKFNLLKLLQEVTCLRGLALSKVLKYPLLDLCKKIKQINSASVKITLTLLSFVFVRF